MYRRLFPSPIKGLQGPVYAGYTPADSRRAEMQGPCQAEPYRGLFWETLNVKYTKKPYTGPEPPKDLLNPIFKTA